VAHGTIGANALVYQALVGPGDTVASVTPTYQQHVSLPEALGATVNQVPLLFEDNYALEMDALAGAAKGAKLITLVNPNNPTGAVLTDDQMRQVVEIAVANDAYILADEVYRGTNQADPGSSTSFADLYPKAISTGSMSKAFALAGLRMGWLVGPKDVLEAAEHHRDYTTISVGIVNDHLSCIALQNADKILTRSQMIVRANHAIVSEWMAGQNHLSWVAPAGGTTALLHYPGDGPSYELAQNILSDTGVLVTPGSALGAEGTLRLGYANHSEVLRAGLPLLGDYLAKL